MARTKLLTPNFRLWKRADGYYDIRYTDTETGKTKNKATGTQDAKKAEEERSRFAAEWVKPTMSSRPTIEEVCKTYAGQRADKVASPKNLSYSFVPIIRHMGSLYADTVTQATIDGYVHDRREERPERSAFSRFGAEPVGDSTINKELRMLRAAMNWAHTERKITYPPTFKIELSSGGTRVRWLTKEEVRALVDASSPHLALFIMIAVSTGKRRSAILGLTWDRVDLSKPRFETLDFGDDVGNKRRGLTPIGGIRKLIDTLHAEKTRNTRVTQYVIEYKGKPVKDIKVALTKACKRAGIEQIGTHVLKHTAVTWMMNGGKSFEQIAKFTNTSKEVIERTYSHLNTDFIDGMGEAVSF